MNLIYICVFHQASYINLLKMLITSIVLKGELNKENTDILIITSPIFQPIIQKELSNFDLPFYYYILDLYTLFDAGCARLNIFNYDNIDKYNKILYLDTDILINNNLNILFNLEISPNKIYSLEEGNIGNENWGGLFFDFLKYDLNQPGFSSGILLFMNSDSIKSLFNTINIHIIDYIYNNNNPIPVCLDQPFIVYNALLQNKYDNKLLNIYIENNPNQINFQKIIYHFPGGPGNYESKFDKMNAFWTKIKFAVHNKKKYIIQVGSHIRNTSNDPIFGNINKKLEYILIEPVPYLYNILKENYKEYDNITCLNIAISNKNGTLELYTPSHENDFTRFPSWTTQLSSTNIDHIKTFVPECIIEKITVECKTLNTLIREFNIQYIDSIITDTEGYDYDILIDLDLYIKPTNIIFENKHMDGPKHSLDINNAPKYYKLLEYFKSKGYGIISQTMEDTHIKYLASVNIYDDIWTCSDEMRYDIADFFKDKSYFKIAEIGAHKGYTTRILSYLFSHVYAIDNNIEWTHCNIDYNKDRENIEYIMIDIYKDKWDIIPSDIDISFIDASHSYENCKSDIINSIETFNNLKYIIFDDYGVWPGVKKVVDEMIQNKTLVFEKFIGLTNVPAPNGIINNTYEGIICSLSKN